MHTLRSYTAARLVIAFAYALAMLVLPLAHHAPRAANGVDLAAYALPDGSLPALCTTGSVGGQPIKSGSVFCDACLLMSAPGVALAQAAAVVPDLKAAAVLGVTHPAPVPERRHAYAGQPRAPPHLAS